MAKFWRSKTLLAKIETTYGVDPVPTGAANAILAVDVKIMPMEGNDVSRELDLPYMGADGTIAAELHAKMTFKVELSPSGTAGTAPAWGPLLRACGCAQTIVAITSVTYNPVSTAHESVTFYLNIGGTAYKLSGARGTCVFRLTAQAIPYLEFEFTGLFSIPTEAAAPVPVLTAFQKPLLATKVNTPTFTVNAVPLIMRTFVLNLGVEVEKRFLIGSESILIVDRAESIETTVEAEALSTINPFSLAAAQTAVAVSLVHGTAAGARATIAVPAAQMQRTQSLENAQNIKEWPLRMQPLPTAGNDQWTLALT